MHLTPAELDRLLIFQVAELARRRLGRGLPLNVPETVAVVADAVCEAARDGARLADAVAAGAAALRPDQVLPGVADVVTEVAVEAVFDDGTRLAVVRAPVGPPGTAGVSPGLVEPGPRPASAPRDAVRLAVTNTAPVPVTVTSHFHFFEANPRLRFDRARAYGRHLAVPSGDHVRVDPGATVEVDLVPFAGERVAAGFAGLVDGPLDAPGAAARALERARACGFLDTGAGDRPPEGGDTDGAVAAAVARAVADGATAGPRG